MRRVLLAAVTLFATLALTERAAAQICPYVPWFTSHGPPGCSLFGAPTLSGVHGGPTGCSVTLTFTSAPILSNEFLIGNWMLIGLEPISVANGTSCPFLVYPKDLFPLPPVIGVQTIQAALPPDTALIGSTLLLQGVTIKGFSVRPERSKQLSAGLRLDLL